MIIEAPPVVFLDVPQTARDAKASVWTLPRHTRIKMGLEKSRVQRQGPTDPIARTRGRSLRVEKRLLLEQMATLSPCETIWSSPTGAELTCEIGGRVRQVSVTTGNTGEVGVTVRDPDLDNLFKPTQINTGDIANVLSAATGADAQNCAVAIETDPKNAELLVPGPNGRMNEKFPGVILDIPAQACGVVGPLEFVEAVQRGTQVDNQGAVPDVQTAPTSTAASTPQAEPTPTSVSTPVVVQTDVVVIPSEPESQDFPPWVMPTTVVGFVLLLIAGYKVSDAMGGMEFAHSSDTRDSNWNNGHFNGARAPEYEPCGGHGLGTYPVPVGSSYGPEVTDYVRRDPPALVEIDDLMRHKIQTVVTNAVINVRMFDGRVDSETGIFEVGGKLTNKQVGEIKHWARNLGVYAAAEKGKGGTAFAVASTKKEAEEKLAAHLANVGNREISGTGKYMADWETMNEEYRMAMAKKWKAHHDAEGASRSRKVLNLIGELLAGPKLKPGESFAEKAKANGIKKVTVMDSPNDGEDMSV